MTTETDLQTDIAKTNELVETTKKKASPVVPAIKSADKLDFSVDYNIPTLEEIALPGDEPAKENVKKTEIPIPKHILAAENNTKKNGDITLSPELIDQLGQELLLALVPEIEKSIRYALNRTLASVMDQSARTTKDTVRKRIEELLPKLLKERLENISPE